MHTGPIPESAGTFSAPETKLYECAKCHEIAATCREWESGDGAYEDYKYTCTKCGHIRWVEGSDS